MSQAEISLYYLLEESKEDNVTEGGTKSTIMARFDNADPFMIEKKLGKGLVVQLATTCDADWNNLPMKPAFLPLIQQLVTTTASRLIPRRNLSPGEPAVAVYAEASDVKTVPVETPTGKERVVQTAAVDGQLVASYTRTTRPGIYKFVTAEGTIKFSVQPDREESVADLLQDEKLNELGDLFGGNVVASAAEYLAQDNLRRNGNEIWKYLLMAFLAFLFLEIVLQQRFSRVRV